MSRADMEIGLCGLLVIPKLWGVFFDNGNGICGLCE